jgi:hypothetical protein
MSSKLCLVIFRLTKALFFSPVSGSVSTSCNKLDPILYVCGIAKILARRPTLKQVPGSSSARHFGDTLCCSVVDP